jgi:peptidyl-prolyl cis-trans isomerase SurA
MRFCLPLCALLLAAAPARAEIIDGVAAVVNGDIITLSEVEEHAAGANLPSRGVTGDLKTKRDSILKRATEDLITDKLVSKECKEQNLEPTTPEIDNAIEDVQRSNHIDKATLERALLEQGLTMPKYRDMLSSQLCRMKVVEVKVKNRVTVTDDDVKNAMANQGRATRGAVQELKLRDIYVPFDNGVDAARAAVKVAFERLKKGEDFALVAHETTGPLQKTGGDLGWIKVTDLAPDLQKAAGAIADGRFSDVIETQKGFHLLKVEQRRTASDSQSAAEAREELRNQLMTEKMQKATEDYLAELRRTAEIVMRLP